MARSTLHYKAVSTDDEVLRLAMIRLAKQYGRYGYRKVAELLRVDGWPPRGRFGYTKSPAGQWSITRRSSGAKKAYNFQGGQETQAALPQGWLHHPAATHHPNHIWAINFVHDKLSNGRPYKMLTVLDEYTREALCVAVKPKMKSADVLDALYPLLLRHGKPEYIRSDNGSEFIATALQDWLRKVGIKPMQISPGALGKTDTMNASMEH